MLLFPAAPSLVQSLHVPQCCSKRSGESGMLLSAEEVRVPPGPSTQLLLCLKAP